MTGIKLQNGVLTLTYLIEEYTLQTKRFKSKDSVAAKRLCSEHIRD